MGLFSTLQATRASSSTVGAAITVHSLEVPTVIQLFSETPLKLMDAVSSTATGGSGLSLSHNQQQQQQLQQQQQQQQQQQLQPWKVQSLCQFPKWAAVSYQTVQTTTFETTSASLAPNNLMSIMSSSSSHASKVDLGVWNVKCPTAAAASKMTDALLQQVPACRKFCITIDLSQPQKVEPRLTQIQQALVRFLITNRTEITNSSSSENPAESSSSSETEPAADGTALVALEGEDAAVLGTSGGGNAIAAAAAAAADESTINETTSLFQLRSVQFGVATEDKDAVANKTNTAEESDKKVTIALLLCAVVPASAIPKNNNKDTKKKKATKNAEDGNHTNDNNNDKNDSNINKTSKDTTTVDDDEGDDDELEDYQAKQTRALLVYHLRKYAMLLNCSLVFCNANPDAPPCTNAASSTISSTTPPLVNLHQTALLWREFGLGRAIWNEYESILEIQASAASPTAIVAPEEPAEHQQLAASNEVVTPLVVGPGAYQQDLLETVLLRNAQNPGHWDASKSSVWAILSYEEENEWFNMTNTSLTSSSQQKPNHQAGDQAWLSLLRDSVDTGGAAAAVAAEEIAAATALAGASAATLLSSSATAASATTAALLSPSASTTAPLKAEDFTMDALGLKTPEPKPKSKGNKKAGAAKKPTVQTTPGTTSKADTAAFF